MTPRLVRAGDEDRLAGFTALPIRVNPYQAGFYGPEPVVGVFRPARGAYELVFDTPSRRAAGAYTFRFWVNDTRPPAVRLLTPTVASRRRACGSPFATAARASTRPPSSPASTVATGRSPTDARRGLVEVLAGRLSRGRHTLLVNASDYQETKNNENGARTLPNTRRLTTTFAVR